MDPATSLAVEQFGNGTHLLETGDLVRIFPAILRKKAGLFQVVPPQNEGGGRGKPLLGK
jgi:hypothetical protein